jgi:hypothetical protein
MQTVVLPFAVVRESAIDLIGTSFVISHDGLMVTAQHVVDEASAIRETDPEAYPVVILSNPEVDPLNPGEHYGLFVNVRTVYATEGHDVALFRVDRQLPDGSMLDLPKASLSARVPPVGAALLGLGYTRMTLERHRQQGIRRFFSMAQSFHGSHGRVTDVYPKGRDSSMIPFPSVATDARFDPGMSGGPVFDGSTGLVSGIVCSGLDSAADEHGYSSTAALMVCALMVPAAANPAGEATATLYELMESGAIDKCDGIERVLVNRSKGETELYYEF